MSNVIDSLQLEIEAVTKGDLSGSLTNLKKSLKKLKGLSDSLNGLNGEGIGRLKDLASSMGVLSEAGKSEGLSKAISQLKRLSKIDLSNLSAPINISIVSDAVKNAATTVPAVQPTTTTSAPTTTPPDTTTMESTKVVEKLEPRLQRVWEKIKAVGGAVKNVLGKALQGVWGWMKKVFNPKNIGKGLAKAFQNISKRIQKATKHIRTFGKRLTRIALNRLIHAGLNAIRNAFKEGTANAYQYSKALGGAFAQNMDKLSSSALYLKNSVGAMVVPIVNALTPAIEVLTEKLSQGLNALNQLVAKLSGSSTWTKAIKTPKEYAEAVDSASDANKNFSAGFDELNVISQDSGDSSTDYSSMFEEVAVTESPLDGFITNLKTSISNGDWTGVAETLGEKINSLFDNLDFEKFGNGFGEILNTAITSINTFFETVDFKDIGNKVATFLNNAIANIDFTELGSLLLSKWTILVDLIMGFVENMDWSALGTALGDSIKGVLDKVDFGEWITTICNALRGILGALINTVRTIDWSALGKEIADGLNSIDFVGILGDVGTLVGDLVKGLLDTITSLVSNVDWGQLLSDIIDGIVALITNLDLGGITAGINQAIGSIIAAVIKIIIEIPKIIWKYLKLAWNGIKSHFQEAISDAGGNVMQGLFLGIARVIANVGQWIKEHIFDPFINGFKKTFGITSSPSTVMAEQGTSIIQGLLNGITERFKKVKEFFTTAFNTIKTTISGAWENVKENTGKAWDNISTKVSKVWGNMKEKATTSFESIKEKVADIMGKLGDKLKNPINSVIGFFEKMVNGVIKGLNTMIGALNKLSIKIPDWVPELGGKTFGFDIKTISQVSIPRLAEGGFPNEGQLFIAREAGAEMVGNIGGRTAVANNDQIVEGIYEGVLQAMQDSQFNNKAADFDVKVYIDGKQITSVVEKTQRNKGATIYKGGVVYGV